MKVVVWYIFVILAGILLVTSIIYHNIYIAFVGFVIAIILNKFIKDIPIPKQFESMNLTHKNKK